MKKKVLIRGAGDLASGIALRLHRSGFAVAMTEIPVPTTVRRTVAFSPAVYLGSVQVEDVTGTLCHSVQELEELVAQGKIPVLADERAPSSAWGRDLPQAWTATVWWRPSGAIIWAAVSGREAPLPTPGYRA